MRVRVWVRSAALAVVGLMGPVLIPPHVNTHLQGHIGAALAVGSIYYWGQGVAIDYPRALAAYEVGAEEGDVACQ